MTGQSACGHLVGGGAILWLSWVAGTLAGVLGGNMLGDFTRIGLDAIMPAFFVTALAGTIITPRRDLPPFMISGIASGGLCFFIAPHYAILLGTVCGGIYAGFVDNDVD